MQPQWFTVIPGAGRREYLSSGQPALAQRIDPDGTNVCFDGWRSPSGHRVLVRVLLKTLGSARPVEATLEFSAESSRASPGPSWSPRPAGPTDGVARARALRTGDAEAGPVVDPKRAGRSLLIRRRTKSAPLQTSIDMECYAQYLCDVLDAGPATTGHHGDERQPISLPHVAERRPSMIRGPLRPGGL